MITEEKSQIISQTITNISARGDFKGLEQYRKLLIDQLEEKYYPMIGAMFAGAYAAASMALVINAWAEIGSEGRKMLEEAK